MTASRWRHWTARIVAAAACLLAGLAAAELSARAHDAVVRGIPFASSPDLDHDLKIRTDGLLHGRPNGHFGLYTLDADGFRTVQDAPPAGSDCPTVLLLGASEVFGPFEKPGHELASALQHDLNATPGCVRVRNTAVVGMTLGTMQKYWARFLAHQPAETVVLYPTTLFFADPVSLAASVKRHAAGRTPVADADPPAPATSRFLGHLRDRFAIPRAVLDFKYRRDIRQALARAPRRPPLTEPSQEGVAQFKAALAELVAAIESSGRHVVLVVPGHRNGTLAHASDPAILLEARARYTPFVTEPALAAYLDLAANAVRSLAAERSLALVDADRLMSGCEACFADLNHFTDAGSARLAAALAGPVRASLALGPAKDESVAVQ